MGNSLSLFEYNYFNTSNIDDFIKITVYCDFGNEIDDEQLALFLETMQKKYNKMWTIEIVCCGYGGMTDQESLKSWLNISKEWRISIAPSEIETINNHKVDSNYRVPLVINNNLKYTTLEEHIQRKIINTDYVLVCASLKGWNGLNLNVNKLIIFQGNIADERSQDGKQIYSKGLNSIGSEIFIKNISNKYQDKLIVLSSEQCALYRPTIKYINSLPKNFKKATTETGFKLLIGRIGKNIINDIGIEISKKIAAGLINSNRGRASNFKAMESFMNLLDININKDFVSFKETVKTRSGKGGLTLIKGKLYNETKYNQAKLIAINYFKEIYNIDNESDLPEFIEYYDLSNDGYDDYLAVVKYDWDKRISIYNLTLINLALDHISPNIWNNRNLPYFSNNINIYNESINKIRDIYLDRLSKIDLNKQVNFLNPSYDLYAGFILWNKIENNDKSVNTLYDISPENFFDKVSISYSN